MKKGLAPVILTGSHWSSSRLAALPPQNTSTESPAANGRLRPYIGLTHTFIVKLPSPTASAGAVHRNPSFRIARIWIDVGVID